MAPSRDSLCSGTLVFSEGSLYTGEFIGRHPHGAGNLVMANGRMSAAPACNCRVSVSVVKQTAGTSAISCALFDMEQDHIQYNPSLALAEVSTTVLRKKMLRVHMLHKPTFLYKIQLLASSCSIRLFAELSLER
jgi:hypothetical protein